MAAQALYPTPANLCGECGQEIDPAAAQISYGPGVYHAHCWNEAREAYAAYVAECEDSEGFAPGFPERRPPGRADVSGAERYAA